MNPENILYGIQYGQVEPDPIILDRRIQRNPVKMARPHQNLLRLQDDLWLMTMRNG
jgi:hypothetical protein